jgi:D-alanine-D-alanine ligase
LGFCHKKENMKKNVLLLFGGPSEEHEVSLRSAAAVFQNLNQDQNEILLCGVTREKEWYLQPCPDPQHFPEKLSIDDFSTPVHLVPGGGLMVQENNLAVDCVFLLLHGTDSEDGKLQGLLEWAGLPYTGAGVLGSALGMDKSLVKDLWRAKGLPVVPWVRILQKDWIQDPEVFRSRVESELRYPLFVKPANSGSSVGVSLVNHPEELEAAIKKAFTIDVKIIIEQGIDCREIECAVLGNESPETFPLGEIATQGHEFYDYEAKYLDPNGAKILIPAPLSSVQESSIRKMAAEAYRVAELSGYARMDFFIDKLSGEVYLNEVNTLPGFTDVSMFPMMCQKGGLTYGETLERIVDLAIQRHKSRSYKP